MSAFLLQIVLTLYIDVLSYTIAVYLSLWRHRCHEG